MRRIPLTGALLALISSLLVLQSGTMTAASGTVAREAKSQVAQTAARRRPTEFALGASGFGTRVVGGDIPAASGSTAWRALGCTNAAGLDKENFEAKVQIPGLGTVNGVRTRVWTTKKGDTVTSNASHKVAGITLVDADAFKLEISGVATRASVWHDAKGYHARTWGDLAKLVLTREGEEPEVLAIPAPGETIKVPGLVEISLGKFRKRVTGESAFARSSGLLVKVLTTKSLVRVASSRATIHEGVVAGLMSGYSAGIRADVLDPIINVGRTPLLQMPCQGTDGEVQTRSLASVDIPGVLDAGVLKTSQFGKQTRRGGRAWEQAEAVNVTLLDGAVTIDRVTARANVTRRGRQVLRNINGTATVRLTFNGEVVELPDFGKVDLGGQLTVQQRVVERTRKSIKVIGLQVKLLDGSGATIDIGVAKTQIGRAVH